MWGEELSWRKDVQWLSSSKPWQTIRGGEAIVGRHPPLSLCTQANAVEYTQSNTHPQTHTNSNAHNLLPSSIHPHTPAFKLQQRAACHCHIFFPKSQLKTLNVCTCVCVWDHMSVFVYACVRGWGGCFGKILIGKLYLGAPRDCAATVNDLSEKCIPECTWGALAPGRLLNDLWERDSC